MEFYSKLLDCNVWLGDDNPTRYFQGYVIKPSDVQYIKYILKVKMQFDGEIIITREEKEGYLDQRKTIEEIFRKKISEFDYLSETNGNIILFTENKLSKERYEKAEVYYKSVHGDPYISYVNKYEDEEKNIKFMEMEYARFEPKFVYCNYVPKSKRIKEFLEVFGCIFPK